MFLALKNLLAAIKLGDTQAILAALIALLSIAFGPTPVQATAEGGDSKTLADEIVSECKSQLTVSSTDVGKIGDGKILKFIISILPLLLPLFVQPNPES